jgi:hypothetical protein
MRDFIAANAEQVWTAALKRDQVEEATENETDCKKPAPRDWHAFCLLLLDARRLLHDLLIGQDVEPLYHRMFDAASSASMYPVCLSDLRLEFSSRVGRMVDVTLQVFLQYPRLSRATVLQPIETQSQVCANSRI